MTKTMCPISSLLLLVASLGSDVFGNRETFIGAVVSILSRRLSKNISPCGKEFDATKTGTNDLRFRF